MVVMLQRWRRGARVTVLAAAAFLAAGGLVVPSLSAASATSAPVAADPGTASVTGVFGLVSFWQEQERSGTTAADSYGSHPGTYENAPVLGAGGDPPQLAAGFSDSGPGATTNPYVDVPYSADGLEPPATSSTPTDAQSWGDGWIDSAPSYQTPAGGGYYVEIKAKLPPPAPGLWPALVLYEDGYQVPSDQYAEMDMVERISQPHADGTVDPPTAFQSWHPASGHGAANEIGGQGVDLTGWNTYGVSVDHSGTIQFWFNGRPNGPAIAGGSNALQGMFINAVMSTGGDPDDGWAGVPTTATPSPSFMTVAYVRVFS